IHAVDGLMAVGRDFIIEPGVAVDGLDEFLESMPRSPSFTARDRPFVGSGTVHLHATDDGLPEGTGEWMIEFTPDGFTFTHAHGKGDVAVRAPAETLELLALGRRSLPQGGSGGDGATGGVQLFGDSEVLDRFLAGAVFR
ncbi:MAG: hypothetical protein KDB24_16705, partial [Microthrixaceae bacterium]|nr:hypothetical protein [Microthrixaceae bacterium]